MKIKSIIVLSASLFISYAGFSQIGLGLRSTASATSTFRANTGVISRTQTTAGNVGQKSLDATTNTSKRIHRKSMRTRAQIKSNGKSAVKETSEITQTTPRASGNARLSTSTSVNSDAVQGASAVSSNSNAEVNAAVTDK